MINRALFFVRNELVNYFQTELGDTSTVIELGNIGLFDTQDGGDVNDRVIISLVNIEEESALKNIRSVQNINGGIRYIRPAVNINLYVLFSCNYPAGEGNYRDSLTRLSNIILFFQQSNSFEINNAYSTANDGVIPPEQADFKVHLDLYTLTFEQINHLWGALGGRQMPSVLYKMRLIKVFDQRTARAGTPIIEVNGQERIN